MKLNELKDLAVNAAIEAGNFLNKNKLEEKEIHEEKGRDIKLIIDQDTEKLIRSNLQVTDIPILGEEFGGHIADAKYWVIDPIDGTTNYFRGLDECCVSIALKSNIVLLNVYTTQQDFLNTVDVYSLCDVYEYISRYKPKSP